jgi:hypothetical protein
MIQALRAGSDYAAGIGSVGKIRRAPAANVRGQRIAAEMAAYFLYDRYRSALELR